MIDRAVPLLLLLAGALVVVAIVLATAAGIGLWNHPARVDAFERHCAEAGGHIYQPEIAFCVDSQGRIVEVYP